MQVAKTSIEIEHQLAISLANLGAETIKQLGTSWLRRLSKLPAPGCRVAKPFVGSSCVFDSRKDEIKVVLQQMFEQAACDRRPDIIILVRTPSENKRPYSIGLLFNKLAYSDDCLPASVRFIIRRWTSGKKLFCGGNRFLDGHW